jgi:acetyltransferase-like isoleucine patch superfamily enzyme
LDIGGAGSFIVGSGVDFRRGFVCEISGSGRVTIGDGTIFTSQALVLCTTSIDIGRRCLFGQSTLIADGFHKYRDPDKHLLDQGYDFHPITIGDGAAIAAKGTITSNVGERTLVVAHSVVTKPIPAFCVAGGAPARVLEYLGPPERRPVDLDV